MSQHNQQHNQHNIKEFNPYTFYFVNAIDNHSETIVAENNTTINCKKDNLNNLKKDDLETCLKHSYYKNKQQALKYLDATNQDVGSEQKYLDMKADYNEELINSMNLTLGSIVLAGFIIKNLFYP